MTEILNIRSNRVQRCAKCGIPITPDNDSGWEVFVEAGITQPICGWCEIEYQNADGDKAADEGEDVEPPA